MDENAHALPHGYLKGLSLSERWKALEPTITRLYVDEKRKVEEVQQILRDRYGFDAGIHQLKYQIRQRKLTKKNIPTAKKNHMLQAYEARKSKGKATSFLYKGAVVDNSKLARLVRSQVNDSLGSGKRKPSGSSKHFPERPKITMAPRILMKWNMPYGALKYSHTGPIQYLSPNAIEPTPGGLSDVVARTPAQELLSPPADSPSGLSRAMKHRTRLERAHLFVEGRNDDLLKSLDKPEQIVTSTWLYQFWLFAFKTARHWGKGPRNWTQDLLDLDKYVEQLSISAPGTPAVSAASPGVERHHTSPSQWLTDGITPSILCNWGIHVTGMHYEHADEDDEDDSWEDCPRSWLREHFLDKLRSGLENNTFSNLDSDELPMALSRLLQNSESSRDQMIEDGLAFSIMGRNIGLTMSLARKIKRRGISAVGLCPFHLATSYLSGAYPCCNVFCALLYRPQTFPLKDMYVNDRGHTVLDNLMIAIIKSHTTCLPGDVDEKMKRQRRFAGEEVDICGRWDADSDEMRALFARRSPRIPAEWKHKFCHTSAQVICHCISLMFGAEWKPDIDHPSGLFKQRCQHCGLDLVLRPLHTLVMVAFQLARRGREEEDFFGVIACLLCLLSRGANPMLASELSAPILYGTDRNRGCTHESLNPLELVNRLPHEHLASWSPALYTGWRILGHVLRLSQKAWTTTAAQKSTSSQAPLIRLPNNVDAMDVYMGDSNDTPILALRRPGSSFNHRILHRQYSGTAEDPMEIDDDDESTDEDSVEAYYNHCSDCGNINYFEGSPSLRDLWATTQAEMLTYRRLRDGDSWVSSKINMNEVLESFESFYGAPLGFGFRMANLLRPYCDCGTFLHARDEDCPCVDEVCNEYFSNLEEWERTTYLHIPEKWHCEVEAEEDQYEYDSEDDDHEARTEDDDDL